MIEAQRKVYIAFSILVNNPQTVSQIFEISESGFKDIYYEGIKITEEGYVDIIFMICTRSTRGREKELG